MKRDVALAWALLSAVVFGAAGCGGGGPHVVYGRVVIGPARAVEVVDDDDPRLADAATPIEYAELRFRLDPDSMRPQDLPATVSDREGRFRVPVDAFGAGVLLYEIEVSAERDGLAPLYDATAALPSSSQRLLVTMAPPGRGGGGRDVDVLRETLELGRPYLREGR